MKSFKRQTKPAGSSPATNALSSFVKSPDLNKEIAKLTPAEIAALAEALRRRADNLDISNGTVPESPTGGKIPKGFVLVNLAAWQQKQLRALANRSGITLRGALGWALSLVRQHLESSARIKDITGMNAHDWHEKFGRKVSLN